MNKDLQYYMGLNYEYLVRKLTAEEGGGYVIKIPILKGCMSDGDTLEEAFKNIEDAKQEWISHMLERGYEVAEPSEDF